MARIRALRFAFEIFMAAYPEYTWVVGHLAAPLFLDYWTRLLSDRAPDRAMDASLNCDGCLQAFDFMENTSDVRRERSHFRGAARIPASMARVLARLAYEPNR